MSDNQLYYELQNLPSDLKEEVKHFIEFLISKKEKKENNNTKRKFGVLKGQIKIAKDFETPLDDFKEYMP